MARVPLFDLIGAVGAGARGVAHERKANEALLTAATEFEKLGSSGEQVAGLIREDPAQFRLLAKEFGGTANLFNFVINAADRNLMRTVLEEAVDPETDPEIVLKKAAATGDGLFVSRVENLLKGRAGQGGAFYEAFKNAGFDIDNFRENIPGILKAEQEYKRTGDLSAAIRVLWKTGGAGTGEEKDFYAWAHKRGLLSGKSPESVVDAARIYNTTGDKDAAVAALTKQVTDVEAVLDEQGQPVLIPVDEAVGQTPAAVRTEVGPSTGEQRSYRDKLRQLREADTQLAWLQEAITRGGTPSMGAIGWFRGTMQDLYETARAATDPRVRSEALSMYNYLSDTADAIVTQSNEDGSIGKKFDKETSAQLRRLIERDPTIDVIEALELSTAARIALSDRQGRVSNEAFNYARKTLGISGWLSNAPEALTKIGVARALTNQKIAAVEGEMKFLKVPVPPRAGDPGLPSQYRKPSNEIIVSQGKIKEYLKSHPDQAPAIQDRFKVIGAQIKASNPGLSQEELYKLAYRQLLSELAK